MIGEGKGKEKKRLTKPTRPNPRAPSQSNPTFPMSGSLGYRCVRASAIIATDVAERETNNCQITLPTSLFRPVEFPPRAAPTPCRGKALSGFVSSLSSPDPDVVHGTTV